MKVKLRRIICTLFACCIISGCGDNSGKEYPSEYEKSPSPTISELLLPVNQGISLMGDDTGLVQIDYSNINNGYLMAQLLQDSGKKVKLSITKDGKGNAPYDLAKVGVYETFPMELGSGRYLIKILQNDAGDNYNIMFTQYIDVQLVNEQSAFLYPNQTVQYDQQSETIKKAFELTKTDDTVLKRIASLYKYVVDNISYDEEKAKQVDDIYVLPVIDETLNKRKGICFDYASVLSAMLRSQHIPTRLVTGNTTIEYHAWVEVYIEGSGWINPDILLNMKEWSRMDPTFDSNDVEYDDVYEDKYYY